MRFPTIARFPTIVRFSTIAASLLCLALASATAWADPVFTLSGDLTNGGTFLGTVDIGQYGDAYVQGTYTNGASSFTLPKTYLGEQLDEVGYTTVDVFSVNQSYNLFLIFPDSSLLGYTGGNLCALYSSCFSSTSAYSSFTDGSFPELNFVHLTATPVTAATATPEPASLALLSTGFLALTAMARKRQRR